MRRIGSSSNWLVEPSITGFRALACSLVAVTLPTLIRASIDGVVGCATIPYVPFVLFSAIFLGWKYAAAVALVSSVVSDGLFMGPHQHLFLESACDLFGVSSLLLTSVLIIGFVEAVRLALRDLIKKHTGRIVFSLEDGQTWATWYGHRSPVHLGTENEVNEMMQDYLAQCEFGKRLCSESRAPNRRPRRSRS